MSAPLKVAVVGTGIMGSNHVRVMGQLPDVELVAVVDADLDRAKAAALKSGARACKSIDDLPSDVEAAVIAVPTSLHLETAIALVGRGISVLVEKPLAATVADAERIIEAASTAGVVLAVGHVERFNPAVAELTVLVTEPIHISASRISPVFATNQRWRGVRPDDPRHRHRLLPRISRRRDRFGLRASVVRSAPTVRIWQVPLSRSNLGLTASFMTSRLGQQKIRAIEVTQPDSVVSADLVRSDVTIHRMAHHEYLGESGVSYRQSSVIEIPFIQNRGEPLVLEVEDFIAAVRSGGAPRVGGADALRAVRVATSIVESLRISR